MAEQGKPVDDRRTYYDWQNNIQAYPQASTWYNESGTTEATGEISAGLEQSGYVGEQLESA